MRTEFLQLIFCFLALVLGAGCEELLPKALGVGVPVLLMTVVFLSARFDLLLSVCFAIAAGAVEDAVSSLTPMTSVSYFLMAAVVSRRSGLPQAVAAFAFPCYQLWTAIWMGGFNVFTRILVAAPVGLLTAALLAGVLTRAVGKAAIDERG